MKTWSIALKDTLITFRDRNALLMMIAAPLLIAVVMGLAFGGSAQDTSPISEIPIAVVNADSGEIGETFARILTDIEVNTADGEKPLFAVNAMQDLEAAKLTIEDGSARGVVHIPENFSAQLQASEEAESRTAVVQVFTDPAATISPGIVRSVVGRIATSFSTVVIGNVVAVNQLLDTVTGIPVLYVNEDTGPVSGAVDDAFAPENFTDLFDLQIGSSLAEAMASLDEGDVSAVIRVREGFSQAVMDGQDGESVAANLEVLQAPGSLSAPIVADVANQIALNFGGDANPENAESPSAVLDNLDDLESILAAENAEFGEIEGSRNRIGVSTASIGDGEGFNLLNYFVPSMSIFFLMFAVFDGTRSILDEERDGTLHRLMSTPTSKSTIILGKIGGTFMTGILQFVVLVTVSGLVFGVDWGKEPLGVALMVLATVAAATSLGALVASFARNVNQAGVLGGAITLSFAILGGNFIDFRAIPPWLTPISKLTINRWALEGFFNLTFIGQTLEETALNIIVLFGMAAVFFSLSLVLFNRRFVA